MPNIKEAVTHFHDMASLWINNCVACLFNLPFQLQGGLSAQMILAAALTVAYEYIYIYTQHINFTKFLKGYLSGNLF